MRLIDFRWTRAFPIEEYESREAAIAHVAKTHGTGHVGCMYLGPDGVLGRHPAVVAQLFCVVSGEGTVSGGDQISLPIQAGQAALWEPGEHHEASTPSGMVVMVIEVESAIEPVDM